MHATRIELVNKEDNRCIDICPRKYNKMLAVKSR